MSSSFSVISDDDLCHLKRNVKMIKANIIHTISSTNTDVTNYDEEIGRLINVSMHYNGTQYLAEHNTFYAYRIK